MTVAIIGLGLIGGSLARAFSTRTGERVLGFDTNEQVCRAALAEGAISGEFSPDKPEDCDLLILALRPDAAIATAREIFPKIKRGTVCIDICGVKRAVCSDLTALALENGIEYIGGHPMAGIEQSGFGWSRADMFDGASMVICPTASTTPRTVKIVSESFVSLGFGRICEVNPEEHDRVIAYTSQLAHLVSCGYIKSPTSLSACGLSGGSFKDMTRVARLDESMWSELFLDNRDNLLRETDLLIERLTELRNALDKADSAKLETLLRDGRLSKAKADENEMSERKNGK